MKISTRSITTITLVSLPLFVATQFGCASSKQQALLETIESPISREAPADYESVSAALERARAEKVNLVSPKYFLKAQNAFNRAQEIASKSPRDPEVNEYLRESRTNLTRATESYQASKAVMLPLIEARQGALDVDANKSSPAFGKLEKRFVILTDAIDSDKKSSALEDIPELTNDYRAVVVTSVQSRYLNDARENLKVAERENAKELVPKTFASAQQALKTAEDYIQKDFKSVPMIAQLSEKAVFESKRTVALGRQVKTWKGLSAEELALKMEAMLGTISAGLQAPDFRDQSLESNSTKLSEAAQALRGDSEKLKTDLRTVEGKIPELENKASKLAIAQKSQSNDEQFNRVRDLFSEKEAHVSRQTDKILISLKTIQFKTGDNQIPPQSFELLKKVNKALALFPQPQVIVEGHTDSTGSPSLNKALSEDRANAVKNYLASVDAATATSIEAVGYGSEKPLASNATKDGRAVNRRIDLVIMTR